MQTQNRSGCQGNRLTMCIEVHTIFGLYMDSQAPYKDSAAVPETTKSLASSLYSEPQQITTMSNQTLGTRTSKI